MASHGRIKEAYLAAKARHQENVQKAKIVEEEHSARDVPPWPLYAGVFREYIRSLSRVFPSVKRWADELSRTYERDAVLPVVLDIAGETHPGGLDAQGISASLTQHYKESVDDRVIRVEGDIADRKVQEQIIQSVIAVKGRLKYIVCSPGGGFFGNEGSIYFEHRMGRFLRTLYALMDKDGEFIIDLLISRHEGKEEQQQQIQRLEAYMQEHAISYERKDTEHIRKPRDIKKSPRTEIRSRHTYFRLYKSKS